MNMKSRWLAVWRKVCGKDIHEEKLLKLFNSLVGRYSEKGRHYHNLNHIINCLKEIDGIKRFNDDPAVEIALWYHDCIYDTKAKDNEEKSAAAAYDGVIMVVGYQNLELAEQVRGMILATKHDDRPNTISGQLVVDIDLAGLGKSRKEFEKNGENIRKEYGWASEQDYAKGRLNFFTAMLKKKRIYYTGLFHDKYERRARSNIRLAVRNLEKQLKGKS